MTENKPFFDKTTDTGKGMGSEIVLFNDDFNTFDYVINTLIEVCGHDPEQAEQAALITHYKGKCGIKSGSREVLLPMCDELNHRNLTAKLK
jgi:ATP-dependent Clp protease adaptor protein ClpS